MPLALHNWDYLSAPHCRAGCTTQIQLCVSVQPICGDPVTHITAASLPGLYAQLPTAHNAQQHNRSTDMHATYLVLASEQAPHTGPGSCCNKAADHLAYTTYMAASHSHPLGGGWGKDSKGGLLASVVPTCACIGLHHCHTKPHTLNSGMGTSTCTVGTNPCKKAFAPPAAAAHDSDGIGCNHCKSARQV